MNVFLGSFDGKISTTNQVTIPVSWRNGGEDFVAIRELDSQSWRIYNKNDFVTLLCEIRRKYHNLFDILVGNTYDFKVDPQGRFVLPNWTKLSGSIYFVGKLTHIQVIDNIPVFWSPSSKDNCASYAAAWHEIESNLDFSKHKTVPIRNTEDIEKYLHVTIVQISVFKLAENWQKVIERTQFAYGFLHACTLLNLLPKESQSLWRQRIKAGKIILLEEGK